MANYVTVGDGSTVGNPWTVARRPHHHRVLPAWDWELQANFSRTDVCRKSHLFLCPPAFPRIITEGLRKGFTTVHGTAPDYLSELCRSNAEDTARSRLRSVAHGDLQVPRSKTNFGDRAFAVAGPASWNRLPATIRSSDTLQNFKNQLKAHFFWWTVFLFSIHFARRHPWIGLQDTAPKKLSLYC